MEEKRCAKCLSKIKNNEVIYDWLGNAFCCEFCRSEWWVEIRRAECELYKWWRRGH